MPLLYKKYINHLMPHLLHVVPSGFRFSPINLPLSIREVVALVSTG